MANVRPRPPRPSRLPARPRPPAAENLDRKLQAALALAATATHGEATLAQCRFAQI